MYRILGITLTICLLAAVSEAADYDQNPDRFPSLGFNLTLGGGPGTFDFKSGGASGSQDTSTGTYGLTVDARVPVNQSVTFSTGLAFMANSLTAEETSQSIGQEVKSTNFIFNVGLRYYFNQ